MSYRSFLAFLLLSQAAWAQAPLIPVELDTRASAIREMPDPAEPAIATTGVPAMPMSLAQAAERSQPVTGETTAAGPEGALGPKNPITLRYRCRFPPVVHVVVSDDEAKKWTLFVREGVIRSANGLQLDPFVTLSCTKEQLAKANGLIAAMTVENKLAIIELMNSMVEKPVTPPTTGEYLPVPRLLPMEKKLLKIGNLSKKVRWLFHQVEISTAQYQKIFWGLQIKVLTMYINYYTANLIDALWDSIDGDLDRCQEAIYPGNDFDLLLNVVGMHLMYKDDDVGAFGTLLKTTRQRLQAEQGSLSDYPPATAAQRGKAIKARLDVLVKLIELVEGS
jgi:hypothetical protein